MLSNQVIDESLKDQIKQEIRMDDAMVIIRKVDKLIKEGRELNSQGKSPAALFDAEKLILKNWDVIRKAFPE